ncbi:MAG: signal peptidase [Verrucomicrobiota bacterium]|jgi:signal peptidase I
MNRTLLLDLLLILGVLWIIQGRWPLIPALFWRDKLKDFAKACRHKLRHDRDILDAERIKALEDTATTIEKAAAEGLRGAAAEAVISEHNKLLAPFFPVSTRSRVSEATETVVIAFALAFAVRSLVAQPFVIPTGSMQPTLNGVNVRSSQEALPPTWRGHLDTLYYGRRHFEWIAQGELKGNIEIRRHPLPPPLNILSDRLQIKVDDGAQAFQFPGLLHDFGKNFGSRSDGYNPQFQGKPGDLLFRGWQESGDRLFVDRVSYNFREPRRGEITIFETSGLKAYNGVSLDGQFYVKRLIGLPGETLRLNRDRRLEVKELGSATFRLLGEEKDGPALAQIASLASGYHGWSCIDPESGLGLNLNVIDRAHGLKPENRSLHFMQSRNSNDSISLNWDGQVYRDDKSSATARLLPDGQYEISYLDLKVFFRHSPEEGWVFVELRRANGLRMSRGPNDSLEYTIPENHYFLMGDNTDNSTDCRYFGCVPRKNLVGTALFVFWPFGEHFGPCGKR